MALLAIVVLILIIVFLMVYNMSIHKKIKIFNNISDKISNLSVLQEFIDVIGEDEEVDNKIKKINETIIEKYDIKYSTIVIFNGAEYALKATNVDEKHWDTMKNLYKDELFSDSIKNATPKYVTIETDEEKLPYQKEEFGRAKSAMFFPLYIENIYIGYWIIESGKKHDFDGMDMSIFEVVKENIISTLKVLTHQETIENIQRKDLFSSLPSKEYLYGKGKKIIDKYSVSTVCMFKVTNLPQINEEFSREMGNKIITEISKTIKPSLSKEYLFVRYMGPKFTIVFSGVETEGVINFTKDIKKYVEDIKIPQDGNKKKVKYASPKLNFVVTTYYKGTSLSGLMNKLEEYLDTADINENDINYI